MLKGTNSTDSPKKMLNSPLLYSSRTVEFFKNREEEVIRIIASFTATRTHLKSAVLIDM